MHSLSELESKNSWKDWPSAVWLDAIMRYSKSYQYNWINFLQTVTAGGDFSRLMAEPAMLHVWLSRIIDVWKSFRHGSLISQSDVCLLDIFKQSSWSWPEVRWWHGLRRKKCLSTGSPTSEYIVQRMRWYHLIWTVSVAHWMVKDPEKPYTVSEGSDQAAQIQTHIWALSGCICYKAVFIAKQQVYTRGHFRSD